MKTLFVALSVAAFGLLSVSAVEAKSQYKTNVQFLADGMKSYAKNCTSDNSQCGNWNIVTN